MTDSAPTTGKHPSRRVRARRAGVVLLLLVCAAAVATSVVFYNKYRAAQDGETAAHQQLLRRLGQVIQLPDGEPAIVTVADKTKLASRELAGRVQNGDLLLVYGNAKRLVIYRPSSQKVVDMLRIESAAVPDSASGGAVKPKPASPDS